MGTRKNVTQLMAKSATLSTRKFVRRLDTKSNAMMFQSKNAAKFRSRNVARFPKRSAEMSQEPTARRNTRDNVVQSPGNTASMFLTSIVTKTQHCSPVPVKDCREKPRRHCVLIPSIRTKEVTMQECSITSQPRCEPTTRTVCRDVTSKVEVCNDVPEEECEHQQTPVTRYE